MLFSVLVIRSWFGNLGMNFRSMKTDYFWFVTAPGGNPFSFAMVDLHQNNDGGSCGSYYSLPALEDERIGK